MNLDESVDLAKAWEDVKESMRGMNRWRSSGFSSSSSSGVGSERKAAVESSNNEDQSKR